MDMSPNLKLNLFPDDKPSFYSVPSTGDSLGFPWITLNYLGLIWNPMD
jgi:hypothetical protein